MNRSDIAEIRRRMNPDRNAIPILRGCYVNEKREVVSTFARPLLSFPEEEAEKYLALFRRVLSGQPGRNLLEITFDPSQVLDGEPHKLLTALRNTALKVDEGAQKLFETIIASVRLEGNYLILLTCDAYDVPGRPRDEDAPDADSEDVFTYILCAVCPVKLTKPALSYCAKDNDFHDRRLDWVVAAPELGFMFPAFEERAANIYRALYFTKDTEEAQQDLIDAVFGAKAPVPADAQRETFREALEEALGEDLSFDVVEGLQSGVRDALQARKSDREASAPVITRSEVTGVLEGCGVPAERIAAFEARLDEQFGKYVDLPAQNLIDDRRMEVRMPDVIIRVSPERSDLIETRVIDGVKYLLIRADEGVAVNGVNIHI